MALAFATTDEVEKRRKKDAILVLRWVVSGGQKARVSDSGFDAVAEFRHLRALEHSTVIIGDL